MATSETHGAAVKPSPIHQLSVSAAFESLNEQERSYAHHLSRFVSFNPVRILFARLG
jgi:hypothetical protein